MAQPKDAGALFSGYRDLPFLAREVAVTQVPSVAALTVLRGLPAASADRRAFVGFGDPWFSATQATEARAEQTTTAAETRVSLRAPLPTRKPVPARISRCCRGCRTRPSKCARWRPRFGPTRSRMCSSGPRQRAQVRTMKLDDRRVVMFATHGLVPGDLDGLSQPALALSAPSRREWRAMDC